MVLVRNLGMVPLYLHYIPMEEYGAWLATGGVLVYLTITDFGLINVLTQQAAAAYGARQFVRLGGLLGTGLGIALPLSLLTGLLGLALAPFIPGLMGLHGEAADRLRACFEIVACASALNVAAGAAGGVLRALQLPIAPGLFVILTDLLGLGVAFALLLRGWGLYSIAAGLVVGSAVELVVNMTAVAWITLHTLGIRLSWNWPEAGPLWRLSLYQFGMRAGGQLTFIIDPFVIGVMLGPEAAGTYQLTIRARDTVWLLAGRLGDAMLPSLAHLAGEGRLDRVKETAFIALRAHALAGAVGLAGFIAFNQWFVTLWVGPDKYAGDVVTVLAGVWGFGNLIGVIPYNVLYALGAFPFLCGLAWIDACLRVALLTVFTHLLGVWGPGLAAVISLFTISGWLLTRGTLERLHLAWADLRPIAWGVLKFAALLAILAVAGSTVSAPDQGWPRFLLVTTGFLCFAVLVASLLDWALVRFFLGGAREPQLLGISAAKQSGMDPS